MPYVRMFQSAVDPSEVEQVRALFDDDVKPVFASIDGCDWIELLINVDVNAGGLVDGCAISRWASLEQLEAALESRPVLEALVRVRALLRQEPVTKTFEVVA